MKMIVPQPIADDIVIPDSIDDIVVDTLSPIKTVFVPGVEQNTGKTVCSVTLAQKLSDMGYRVGWIKALGQTTEDYETCRSIFDEGPITVAPTPVIMTSDLHDATNRYVSQGNYPIIAKTMENRLIRAVNELSYDRDIVVVEHSGDPRVGTHIGLSAYYIARNILKDNHTVLVARGGQYNPCNRIGSHLIEFYSRGTPISAIIGTKMKDGISRDGRPYKQRFKEVLKDYIDVQLRYDYGIAINIENLPIITLPDLDELNLYSMKKISRTWPEEDIFYKNEALLGDKGSVPAKAVYSVTAQMKDFPYIIQEEGMVPDDVIALFHSSAKDDILEAAKFARGIVITGCSESWLDCDYRRRLDNLSCPIIGLRSVSTIEVGSRIIYTDEFISTTNYSTIKYLSTQIESDVLCNILGIKDRTKEYC